MALVSANAIPAAASLQLELEVRQDAAVVQALRTAKPFLIGSISGMIATTAIQPIDMLKLRVQLAAAAGQSTQPFGIACSMLRTEGASGFYAGLSAALYRQCVYCGARMGMFDEFVRRMKASSGEKSLPFWKTSVCSLAAGGLGALISNPLDVILVRMQADKSLPACQRQNYTSIGNTLVEISSKEGLAGLTLGAIPTMSRAMAMNFGMLAFNAKAKEVLEAHPVVAEEARVFVAAGVAGFAASVCALPFDFVKTQVQKSSLSASAGAPQYSGALDFAMQQLRHKGVMSFYAGFPVFYCRVAPHAMLCLVVQDAMKKEFARVGV
eukprot:TRINITY_DN90717_c0_g1_i1.p1 TRINITY_DN90717_c0_g1~~TRINITY_DN90717_c0_g1_i1.p1  ORF type:complete len:324 (+),score=65.66 TRINITY_DN90717_c0_g1_i1:142-1113(+)